MKSKISANRRLENQEDLGMSLYIQNFQSKGRQEDKMTWKALLSFVATKRHNFKVPWNFCQAHLQR